MVDTVMQRENERGRVVVEGERTDAEHPAWCSREHCFVTDQGVVVHQQAPTRWEDGHLPPDADSSSSAAPSPVADPSAQDAQDDDGEVAGYFVGECGHPAPLVGPVWHVGPCRHCDASAT